MPNTRDADPNGIPLLLRFREWVTGTRPATSVRFGYLTDPGEHERDCDVLLESFGEILPALAFDLDVAGLLFGDDARIKRLPVSVHRIVREVLDEFFDVGGCYAQATHTGFTLVFPNTDREIGTMKRNAIAVEVERRLRAETGPPPGSETGTARARKRDKELEDLFSRALAKMLPEETGDTAEIDLSRLPWGLEFRYAPMWLVRNKLLTSYVCRPMQASSGGDLGLSDLLLDRTTDAAATTQIDLPMLALARRDLDSLVEQKLSAIVVVPVHYLTISRRPYVDMFLRTCETMSAAVRRLVVFEVVGVPATTPEFRLSDILQHLRKYCRSLLIRVGPALKTFDLFLNLKIHAVGIELGLEGGDEAKTMRALEQFADRAGRYRLKTYAIGVRSTSLTTAIVASGFDYVSGDTIAPPVRAPSGVQQFDAGMLFR